MQSGTIFGYQALAPASSHGAVELADAQRRRARRRPGDPHGGLSAAPWARALEGIDAIDPDLTLKGLAILHAEVAAASRSAGLA
jgi:hypothetical protein